MRIRDWRLRYKFVVLTAAIVTSAVAAASGASSATVQKARSAIQQGQVASASVEDQLVAASISGIDVYWQSITAPVATLRIAQARGKSAAAGVGLTSADLAAQKVRAARLIGRYLTGRAAVLQARNTARTLAAEVRHTSSQPLVSGLATTVDVVADVYTGGGVDNFVVLSWSQNGDVAHMSAQGVAWADDTVYFSDGSVQDQPSRGAVHYEIDLALVGGIWKISNEEVDVLG